MTSKVTFTPPRLKSSNQYASWHNKPKSSYYSVTTSKPQEIRWPVETQEDLKRKEEARAADVAILRKCVEEGLKKDKFPQEVYFFITFILSIGLTITVNKFKENCGLN